MVSNFMANQKSQTLQITSSSEGDRYMEYTVQTFHILSKHVWWQPICAHMREKTTVMLQFVNI